MIKSLRIMMLMVILLLGIGVNLVLPGKVSQAQEQSNSIWIAGAVFDQQNQPVEGVDVSLIGDRQETPFAETNTQADGRYTLTIPDTIPDTISVHFVRAHFEDDNLNLRLDRDPAFARRRNSDIATDHFTTAHQPSILDRDGDICGCLSYDFCRGAS